MAVNIILPQVMLNNANRNSGIAIGENNQPNWHAHQKANYGVGAVFAVSSIVFGNVNVVLDSDVIDGTINDVSPTNTPQNQQV